MSLVRARIGSIKPQAALGTPARLYMMSSTLGSETKAKHEWIVILPDHTGVLETRMKVRQDHLENLTPGVNSGFWRLGGAILDEELKGGEGPKISGSVMLAWAESKEEVLRALKKDVYSQSGVWDWDKVRIHPFKSAFIKP